MRTNDGVPRLIVNSRSTWPDRIESGNIRPRSLLGGSTRTRSRREAEQSVSWRAVARVRGADEWRRGRPARTTKIVAGSNQVAKAHQPPYVRARRLQKRRTYSIRAAHQLLRAAHQLRTCGARGFTRARTSARCARTCASLCAPAVARAPRQRPLERDGRSARSPWPAGYILAKHRRICGFHTRPSYSHRADHPHRAGGPST